jgi:hypothetical protein
LKLKCDKLLSKIAFNCNLRHYIMRVVSGSVAEMEARPENRLSSHDSRTTCQPNLSRLVTDLSPVALLLHQN